MNRPVENQNKVVAVALWNHLSKSIPRILTQLDRDQDSPTFGSFDRHFWHYKIRDYSSMILQQGMLILQALKTWEAEGNPLENNPIVDEWIDGCIQFWVSQQLSSGSFNEYYPFEEGFPPTAFSLYSVSLIFQSRGFPELSDTVRRAVEKASAWLLSKPETEALNQETAALAGLVIASKIPGIRIDQNRLEKRLQDLFGKQSEEGWFDEYCGPDIGYLSVTVDCLWDIYKTTGDVRAKEAVDNAVKFIASMISVSGNTPVMINSRNTDYIVPYGLVCAAQYNPLAGAVVKAIYRNVGKPGHFLSSTDDRYACHYVYQSCFRSLQFIEQMLDSAPLPCEEGGETYFNKSNVLIRHIPNKKSIYVSGRKGGIAYLFTENGIKDTDFGWKIKLLKGKFAVTHWQDPEYNVKVKTDIGKTTVTTEGMMTSHAVMTSSPLHHIVLRIVSFFTGRRIIPLLKKAMIFNNPPIGIKFLRNVIISDDSVVIEDSFMGEGLKNVKLKRAAQYSMRHVASASNFALEELVITNTERSEEDPAEGTILLRTLK